MNYNQFRRSQKKHIWCVVCGKEFAGEFVEEYKAFPAFHPTLVQANPESCEDRFYHTLLMIYRYLHELDSSQPMTHFLRDWNWPAEIRMKKEMLQWCLCRGFLSLDSLNRIEIPPPIRNVVSELFTTLSLNNPVNQLRAMQVLKEMLARLQDELTPVELAKIIEQTRMPETKSMVPEPPEEPEEIVEVVLENEKKDRKITTQRKNVRDRTSSKYDPDDPIAKRVKVR